MEQFTGSAKVPALQALVEQLSLFVQDNWLLRKVQAKNTARAKYFYQGALTDTANTGAEAAMFVGGVLLIEPAQQSDQVFSYLYITTDDASGFGRYMIDGTKPTPAGRGFQIIDQGAAILIAGHENIKGFRMIAETGQTLNYSINLFQ